MRADREAGVDSAWLLALRRYLAVIAVGNLLWEFAHMPLYTLWESGSWSQIIFAALHCTGGDMLIALSALTLTLMLLGTSAWPQERFALVAALTVATGVSYTAFSEYLNIVIRAARAYSELMPVLSVGGFPLGMSPLLQWLVIPSLALLAARQAAVTRTDATGKGTRTA